MRAKVGFVRDALVPLLFKNTHHNMRCMKWRRKGSGVFSFFDWLEREQEIDMSKQDGG